MSRDRRENVTPGFDNINDAIPSRRRRGRWLTRALETAFGKKHKSE